MNPKYYKIYDNEVANPFEQYKIDDNTFLDKIEERTACGKCKRSRKYFCYNCNLALPICQDKVPQIRLPFKIDIIKHDREVEGKSTATHAAIIAPQDVKIYIYPGSVPDYSSYERTILIYPSKTSLDLSQYIAQYEKTAESHHLSTNSCNSTTQPRPTKEADNVLNAEEGGDDVFANVQVPFDRAVFIDATWPQSKGIMSHSSVKVLPCVTLNRRMSHFWRHQKNSPRWFLATIEAIHQLLYEVDPNHNGRYDNLLFFFEFMYRKIHSIYSYESLLAYKRKMTSDSDNNDTRVS